jgi:hypothetical protein
LGGSEGMSAIASSIFSTSAGFESAISAFSSDTARMRVVRGCLVTVAARVLAAGFAFSSSVEFVPLVRTLETCVIFLGDNGDCTAGVLARVCRATGFAASVGLAVAAEACLGSCGSSDDFAVAVLVDRFGGGADFVVLVFRVGSGATVSAFFALVARVVVGFGASSMICNSSSSSSCSGSTASAALVAFVARVARVLGAGAAVFAVVDAVARLTGFLRSVKLASSFCTSSAGPVRAPRRVATIFAVWC